MEYNAEGLLTRTTDPWRQILHSEMASIQIRTGAGEVHRPVLIVHNGARDAAAPVGAAARYRGDRCRGHLVAGGQAISRRRLVSPRRKYASGASSSTSAA